jgi:glycosyltransferase involved in cell wall biosynthesis
MSVAACSAIQGTRLLDSRGLATPLQIHHLNTERTWRGGEDQLLALAQGLARRGHANVVVAQEGGELSRRARAAGLPTTEVRMRGEWDLAAVGRIAALLRRDRPDLLHMHTSHAHTLGVLASKATGIARRVVSRRVDFSIHRHALSLSGLKYRFGVDRYVAVSHAVAAQLVRDGVDAARISVVHDGVDPDRFPGGDGAVARTDLGVPAGAPLIGTLAHFGWHKSLETLIAAASDVVAAVPDAWIAIVGDGSLRPMLEAERAKSPVRARVLLPGFRDNVADFLAAYDVFVMPSVMEGLCTSIMDAFAVGVPVVACAAGGIPELVQDGATGLLVPVREPRALAAALVRMVRDADLRRTVTANARAALQRGFTHDTMVEGTLAVYREVLARAV